MKKGMAGKLRRMAAGHPPRVLDLFCGCGGLSLGFHAAGGRIVAGVESDPIAAESHALNFFSGDLWHERHARPHDVLEVDAGDIVKAFDLGKVADSVDVIVAGPPCQAFARVGRAKLRSVVDHPEAFRKDPRGDLYLHLLDFIRDLRPLAVLIENVPDMLNYGGVNLAEDICDQLEGLGYAAKYTLLNSARYGVPQTRERMFLMAYAGELEVAPRFPRPTHSIDLPSGYRGTRGVALSGRSSNGNGADRYMDPPQATGRKRLPPAVTAREALADLPRITRHLRGELRRGARRFDEWLPYPEDIEPSEYGIRMRNWRGFRADRRGVSDHVIRSLPRDYPIFRKMPSGAQYPEAHKVALRLLERESRELGVREGTAAHRRLEKTIVPPYDPGKFPNKWRKMEPDRPARTLMAHLGKDSYSHIHFDSRQARTISVREAARLQSFPDGFRFAGTMNPAFRQIGNAVPPLLAKALARELLGQLRRSSR